MIPQCKTISMFFLKRVDRFGQKRLRKAKPEQSSNQSENNKVSWEIKDMSLFIFAEVYPTMI